MFQVRLLLSLWLTIRSDLSRDVLYVPSGHDTFESGLRRFVMDDLLLAV